MAGIDLGNLLNENSMVFSSLEFLFRFLPVFLLCYIAVPKKGRNALLFVASIIMYAMAEPFYVFLLLGMSVFNYLTGLGLDTDSERKRKLWLAAGVCANAGLLIYSKISNAFDANFLLTLGISFYTFKSISYLADVYQGEADAEHSFWRFGAYLCMFPQMVSGPIMRYSDACEGLDGPRLKLSQAEEGLKKVVLGLSAKVLLADQLAILWNDIQTIGFESISTPLAWLGAFSYSLQLYFDFCGYSLIAIGIGQMLGYPVIRNFHHPYAATSISDFWRRWHITLGSWFRDYVYIPLGGNRKGTARTLLNLLMVWVLTGLWHGGSANFIVWGLTLCLFIMLEKLFLGKWLKKHKIAARIYVWFFIPLTWIIFAITSGFTELETYFARLFPFFGVGTAINSGDFVKMISNYGWLMAAGILCCIPAVSEWYQRHCRKWYVIAGLALLFWLCVYRLSIAGNNPFMYFRF